MDKDGGEGKHVKTRWTRNASHNRLSGQRTNVLGWITTGLMNRQPSFEAKVHLYEISKDFSTPLDAPCKHNTVEHKVE